MQPVLDTRRLRLHLPAREDAAGDRRGGDERNWVIVERATAALAGTIGLRVQGHRMELGYVLARRCWGQGVATEAAEAVVTWALAQPEVQRVWAVWCYARVK